MWWYFIQIYSFLEDHKQCQSRSSFKLKIMVNLVLNTLLFIYAPILEMVQSVHHVCKWLVSCIKLQRNHAFWNGSGNANRMICPSKKFCRSCDSIPCFSSWLKLFFGHLENYFCILGQEGWRLSFAICHLIKFLFGRNIIPRKHDLAEA